MAIIKRTPRPGELVRGATAGDLAAFGPDGELVDSGVEASELEYPSGGNTGDVLGKGANGPEWVPHYPAGGSVGDNLSLGADGPAWSTPTSKKYYLHSITVARAVSTPLNKYDANVSLPCYLKIELINEIESPITSYDVVRSEIAKIADGQHPYSGITLSCSQVTGDVSGVSTTSLIGAINGGVLIAANSIYLPDCRIIAFDNTTGDILSITSASLYIDSNATVGDKVTEL